MLFPLKTLYTFVTVDKRKYTTWLSDLTVNVLIDSKFLSLEGIHFFSKIKKYLKSNSLSSSYIFWINNCTFYKIYTQVFKNQH